MTVRVFTGGAAVQVVDTFVPAKQPSPSGATCPPLAFVTDSKLNDYGFHATATGGGGKMVTKNGAVFTGSGVLLEYLVKNGVGNLYIKNNIAAWYVLNAAGDGWTPLSADPNFSQGGSAPTITGFSVSPAAVNAGQSVTLNATVANATTVTLDGATITLPYVHKPSASRAYQIVATNANGSATSPSIAVTVTAIAPPPPSAHGLTVDLDFGGGSVAHFSAGTSLGRYVGEFVQQDCFYAKDPAFPDWRVYFRPDADGSRDEVVVEYGRSLSGTPVILGPYTATVKKNGVTVYTVTVAKTYWYQRWRYQSSERPVVRSAATLIARHWLPNFNKAGLFNATQNHFVVTYPGPGLLPDDAGKLSGFTGYMQGPGDNPQIGHLTEYAADYVLFEGPESLRSSRTEAEWTGNAPWHIRDDATGGILNAKTPLLGFDDSWLGTVKTVKQPSPFGSEPGYIYPDQTHMYPLAVLPAMLTDDPYLLEEVQFTVNVELLGSRNTRLNNNLLGLVSAIETRGMAWALRDMVYAAQATPDNVPSWLLPKSYFADCINDCATYTMKWVNCPARITSVFRILYTTGFSSPWMQAWLATSAHSAIKAGYSSWKPCFDWMIQQQISLSSGTSGWSRQWATPYQLFPDRARSVADATNFGLPTDTSRDATTAATWAECWADYKTGLGPDGKMRDNFHTPPFPLDDSTWDGEMWMPHATHSNGTYSYPQHLRAALAGAVEQNIPLAKQCYDYIHRSIAKWIAADGQMGQKRFAVSPPQVSWTFALPAPGHIGTISTNVLQDVAVAADQATPDCSDLAFMRSSLHAVTFAWGSSSVSLIKDASGATIDFIYWISGGGHGDSGWDGLAGFRASTGKFEVFSKPTHWQLHPTTEPMGEYDPVANPGHQDSHHAYQHCWARDSDEGGVAFFTPRMDACGQGARNIAQAHRFDEGTRTWTRWGDSTSQYMNGGMGAYSKDTKRKILFRMPNDNAQPLEWFDYTKDALTYQRLNESSFRPGIWTNPTGCYDPLADMYLVNQLGILRGYYAWDLTSGAHPMTQDGAVPTVGSGGLMYDKSRDVFYMMPNDASIPVGTTYSPVLYIGTPTRDVNKHITKMTWATRTFAGTTKYFGAGVSNSYNRWQYVDALDALIVCPTTYDPMEIWKL